MVLRATGECKNGKARKRALYCNEAADLGHWTLIPNCLDVDKLLKSLEKAVNEFGGGTDGLAVEKLLIITA
jgi:hypothetical protein